MVTLSKLFREDRTRNNVVESVVKGRARKRGLGFGERNGEGKRLLKFAGSFDFVATNSCFPKCKIHLN